MLVKYKWKQRHKRITSSTYKFSTLIFCGMPFHMARKVVGSTECSLAEATLERSVAGMTTIMAKFRVKILNNLSLE